MKGEGLKVVRIEARNTDKGGSKTRYQITGMVNGSPIDEDYDEVKSLDEIRQQFADYYNELHNNRSEITSFDIWLEQRHYVNGTLGRVLIIDSATRKEIL